MTVWIKDFISTAVWRLSKAEVVFGFKQANVKVSDQVDVQFVTVD